MARTIKLLYVDDEFQFSNKNREFLGDGEAKIDVTTVQTPKKALNLLEKEDFDGIVATLEDKTGHVNKERELKASEERYRRLFETAQDGMLILNAETGKINDANPYIQDLIGYSKEELVGRELWEIGTFKSVVENRERFQELVEEGYIRYEDLPLRTKEGREAPVEFVSNTYMAGEEKVVQCNIRDISKRKEAEEREEFLHSLLRHDVKNRTQVVKGYLELLEEELDLPFEAKDYIKRAKKAAQSSDEIIEKVRKLREIEQEDEIEDIYIDSVLDRISSDYKSRSEKEGIDIDIEETGCRVKGGPLLQEAVSNLVENSIIHSNCDEIRIKAECEGEWCIVTVEDDGKGIADDIKE
ncbi:MAG: PAS domain S-box protein, partial [Candidatus Saliniplasma sp.]